MTLFRVRVERLVQEVAWVQVEANSPEDAVAAALTKDDLDFASDAEACHPYAYSISDEAAAFEYTLGDARAEGAEVGQLAQGTGLETLTSGSLMAAWERKLLDQHSSSSTSTASDKGL
ncbi:hypothetical protein [Polaromonas sp. YR568]|uniref:hypothetical protein n=1 Tax=Polaromonas sp. YR568 TaxID=1855301 RepID=UPI003137C8AC